MGKPKALCLDCDTIFNRKGNSEEQTCWNCGSTNYERLSRSGKRLSPPTGGTTSPPVTPGIPKPPAPPPLFKTKTIVGGGAITPEMLLNAKAGLKKVVRQNPPLPGPKDSAIPRGIRVLANMVKSTLILGARWGIRSTMNEYPGYFFTEPQIIDLKGPLHSIAKGSVNPDHGNFNTDFHNMGRELPSGLFKTYNRRHPFRGSKIYYLEYGWKRTIVTTKPWYQEARTGAFVQVPKATQRALEGWMRVRGNQINSDRLILAETGEVIYTPDHYITFYRYSMSFLSWYRYESAEKLHGKGAEWDESFYSGAA